MSSEQLYGILDYETYSELDLKKVGSFEYSMHPSTDIICAAWRVGTRETLLKTPTKYWSPLKKDSGDFAAFYQMLFDMNIILVAHNALFEQVITTNVFLKKHMYSKSHLKDILLPNRWVCTASMAAALALPRNLEGACHALSLPVKKDMEGRRLILKWCKPRKKTKNNDKTRHDDPAELDRLIQYCRTDVDAETHLFLKAKPLSAKEREVWLLDQAINLRGFKVDRPLVKTVLGMITDETQFLNSQTEELTFGILRSATQRDAVKNYLEAEGVYLPDLRRKTVEDAIKENLVEGDAKRLLELRLAVSKSSTAKYAAFDLRSRTDGYLRDILVYHTASTGRWGGAGVQPQNFPRGTIKDSIGAAEVLADGDLEMVRMIYGEPMEVFSNCLRNMIVASEGYTLDVADYAAIEARVLFWVAKHEAGLKAFREGRDLYREQASEIFSVGLDTITSFQRFVGKQTILGCGYMMGAKRFKKSCADQGQDIPLELAEAAVKSYRASNRPVVELWGLMAKASVYAVENVGKQITVRGVTWFVKDGFLFCRLPSGRCLAYHKPRVAYEATPWGEKRPVLYHWGVDSLSKKWTEQRTYGGLLVENVVQAISRDLMAEAMLKIEKAGPWRLVLTVHDELIAERKLASNGTLERFCELMSSVPDWAAGLPIKVEGWSGSRYKK